jgi:hypothetical protein
MFLADWCEISIEVAQLQESKDEIETRLGKTTELLILSLMYEFSIQNLCCGFFVDVDDFFCRRLANCNYPWRPSRSWINFHW